MSDSQNQPTNAEVGSLQGNANTQSSSNQPLGQETITQETVITEITRETNGVEQPSLHPVIASFVAQREKSASMDFDQSEARTADQSTSEPQSRLPQLEIRPLGPPAVPNATIDPAAIFRRPSPAAQSSSSSPGPRLPSPEPRHPTANAQNDTSERLASSSNHQLSTPTPATTTVGTSLTSAPIPARPKTYRTGYIYDMLMMLHCVDGYQPTEESVQDSGDGHPEEPMRIKRIYNRLREAGLIARMKKLPFEEVSFEQVMLVHSEDHWMKVQGTENLSDETIQATKHFYEQLSLYVCRETAHCARLSCGGVIKACEAVCTGEVRNAFAIVRPPGHHAEPDEHMGFCFYNNVAVATKEVQRLGLAKKVLILDWDVHHGNGTQRAFWDDPSVLYISIHRHDGGKFYPTSDFGALDMVGIGAGAGTSVNIPWPGPGHGDADYLYAFQKIVMPIAYEFAPDLVIISAGFDAAEGDTLGQCNVTPPAYGHMTHMLCAIAGGKVVVALEGGYNLKAISDSSVAVAQVLLGETPAELPPLQASEVATEVMYQVAKVQSKYWKSIDVKSCEPPELSDVGDMQLKTSIPELLKAHRAYHLFNKHGLYQIPLASEELQQSFDGQVVCSQNVYDAGTNSVLVVFVHDFGNLRVETDGVATTNIHMTNSYLLDTSDLIVDWVTKSGYALIDVNILMALPTQPSRGGKNIVTKAPAEQARLMKYLWDNYIELSECENVVFIGHGSGCQAVLDLINSRDVDHKVKAVIQVAGLHSLVRIDPNNERKGIWFRSSSQIYVPQAHPILEDERARRKLGSQIIAAEKAEKVVDVLNAVLPDIQAFVASKVKTPTPEETLNGTAAPESHTHAEAGPSNSTAEEDMVMEESATTAPTGSEVRIANGDRQTSVPPIAAAS